MSVASWQFALATLAIGAIVGYLGQRSRFCTISGIRDFFLVKDSYRLKGLIGIIIGGVIGFGALNLFGVKLDGFSNLGGLEVMPFFKDGFTNIEPTLLILISAIGVFFMAYFSVMAEGCPFRQHILAGEGRSSGIIYLAGFLAGAIFYNLALRPFLESLMIGA